MKIHLLLLMLNFFSLEAIAQGSIDSSLVLYLPFNGNANDSSINQNNGNVFGATLTADKNGLANSAYYFNGTSSYIQMPFHPSYNVTEFTIVAQVKPMGFYSGLCQGNVVLWKGNTQITGHYGLSFSDNIYDNYNCNNFDTLHQTFFPEISSNSTGAVYTPFIQTNTWYCVIATFGNDSTKLFVDGALAYYLYTPNAVGVGTDAITLGYNFYNAQYPYWFNGVLDEIRIYSRVISDIEVNALCGSGVGLYELNKASKTSIYPNPATSSINISGINNSNIIITNYLGEKMLNKKFVNNPIDVSFLKPGIYFLKAENKVTKFVKD